MTSLFTPHASPALAHRSPSYPFHDRVPLSVRMRSTTWPRHAAAANVPILPLAFVGQEYRCYVSSCGAVVALLPFEQMLVVEPGSYEVVSWHPGVPA